MTDKKTLDNLFHPDVASRPGVVIYSEHRSPRLSYVCHFIFNQVLSVNYSLTNDLTRFENADEFKINYSEKEIKDVFKITPERLLFEQKIDQVKPLASLKNDSIYFYETARGDLGCDIFASVFYFISRYEEWQNFKPDSHQRFEAEHSLLFANKFHLKPVVDTWIVEFKTALEKFYPQIEFPKKKMQVMSTIDVDNLYAYRHKGIIRTIGAGLKDLAKFDLKNLKNRLAVLLGSKKDPFDIYEGVSSFCKESQIPLIYFFLFRTGTQNDRTVNPKSGSRAFKTVFYTIKKHGAFIGLHPSYDSAFDKKLLEKEVKNINATLGATVNMSRQHFLRFDIRSTPNLLLENGIRADFTMGFASSPGFRAGTSFPFYYYDLNAEKETELLFFPFCAMDGAYTVYKNTDPETALQSMLNLANEVNKVNGFFITVFHERTFSDHLYKGFGTLYKILHQKVKQL